MRVSGKPSFHMLKAKSGRQRKLPSIERPTEVPTKIGNRNWATLHTFSFPSSHTSFRTDRHTKYSSPSPSRFDRLWRCVSVSSVIVDAT